MSRANVGWVEALGTMRLVAGPFTVDVVPYQRPRDRYWFRVTCAGAEYPGAVLLDVDANTTKDKCMREAEAALRNLLVSTLAELDRPKGEP